MCMRYTHSASRQTLCTVITNLLYRYIHICRCISVLRTLGWPAHINIDSPSENLQYCENLFPIASFSVYESLWNFAQSMAVWLLFSVKNYRMIHQLKWMLWSNRNFTRLQLKADIGKIVYILWTLQLNPSKKISSQQYGKFPIVRIGLSYNCPISVVGFPIQINH